MRLSNSVQELLLGIFDFEHYLRFQFKSQNPAIAKSAI